MMLMTHALPPLCGHTIVHVMLMIRAVRPYSYERRGMLLMMLTLWLCSYERGEDDALDAGCVAVILCARRR